MVCVEEGSQPLGVVSGVPPDGALERYDLSGHTRLDAGTVMDVGVHYQRLWSLQEIKEIRRATGRAALQEHMRIFSESTGASWDKGPVH